MPPPFLSRLRDGLVRTRDRLTTGLVSLVRGRALDDALYDDLEELLLSVDAGPAASGRLIAETRRRAREERVREADRIPDILASAARELLGSAQSGAPASGGLLWAPAPPTVVLVVGVNGVGKTTTAGKLAALASNEGHRVVLAAADTYRAAAGEQLAIWARRSGADLIRHGEGADPAAVVFDAVAAARARGRDLVLVDTAGRLHTKSNLMEELRKVARVAGRAAEGAPHDTLLVLDAVTGQNGIAQARAFHEALGVRGIVLTKLDGTARGGVVLAIAADLGLPVRYVGLGESLEDLQPFDPDAFVEALFKTP